LWARASTPRGPGGGDEEGAVRRRRPAPPRCARHLWSV